MTCASQHIMTGKSRVGLMTIAVLLASLCAPVPLVADGGGGDDHRASRLSTQSSERLAFGGQQGACCAGDGSCSITTSLDCTSNDGAYLGDGTACSGDVDGDGRDDACPCTLAADCDDGTVCTNDACTTGACVYTNNTDPCDDGDDRTTGDTCSEGACVGSPWPGFSGGVAGTCVTAATGTHNWSDDIWGLLGGGFPDSSRGPDSPGYRLCVTLPNGATITLDTSVEIEALWVQAGAVLELPPEFATDGDLTIRDGSLGGIVIDGEIKVSCDHRIRVLGGFVTIAGAGKYVGVVAGESPVSVVLEAKGIILEETFCGVTDQMTLIENMRVITTEDFEMNGEQAITCPAAGGSAAAASALLGGKTSPILTLRATMAAARSGRGSTAAAEPELTVGGSFRMIRMAEPCIGCDAAPGSVPPVVLLHGDFDNQSEFPAFFDWDGGKLILAPSNTTHTFEVAGIDLGATVEGFNTAAPPNSGDDGWHTNFSIGIIEIGDPGGGATGTVVEFVNAYANTRGTGADVEALYVRQLILNANTEIRLGDSHVYYCDLEDRGATFVPDDSRLIRVPDCVFDVPTVSHWGLAAMVVLIMIAGMVIQTKRARRLS